MLLMILYLFTIGLSASSCGWLLLKAERSRVTVALSACQLLVIIWCVPQLFLGFPMTKETKYLAYGISYLGISLIGPAWLIFSFSYCGREPGRKLKALLFGISICNYLIFLTNEWHHQFYRYFQVDRVVYGWVFFVHMAYTYFCVLLGMGAVLGEFWKKRVAALHLGVILLSAAVPLGFNLLYLSGWAGTSFDLTPLAFALSSFLMLLAVLRYDFLDVNSLAFGQIFSSIAEGVVIYNKRGTVVYCNASAGEWLGIREGDSFDIIRERMSGQRIEMEPEREMSAREPVFTLENGGKIRIRQYIKRQKDKQFTAGIFLLTDVGEYYERLRQSRELAVSARRLAIEKERNRIAQEVHDTTGHTLTMIQSLLRLIRVEWEQAQTRRERDPGKVLRPGGEADSQVTEYLTQAQELAADGLRELRVSINQLRRGTDGRLVTEGVYQLAKQVKEMEVEVSVQGEDGPGYSHLSMAVYECLREAITNCLKYARATHMDVILKFEPDRLLLYIFDNGQGCETIVESNGIKGIRDRVKEVGGQVRFLSSAGEGFQIYICLPAERMERMYDSGSDSR